MLDTQLLAFLESKPAEETYEYQISGDCAAAQFNRSVGRRYEFIPAVEGKASDFDNKLEAIAYQKPQTFGAMLERAKKEFA